MRIIKGYLEEYGALLPFKLTEDDDGWTLFVNNELADDLNSLDEIIDSYQDTYYPTKQDYKAGNASSFTKTLNTKV